MSIIGCLDLVRDVLDDIEKAFETNDFEKAFETILAHDLFESYFIDAEPIKKRNGCVYHFFWFSNDKFLKVYLFLDNNDNLYITVKIESKLPPFEIIEYSRLAEGVHTDADIFKNFVEHCKKFYNL